MKKKLIILRLMAFLGFGVLQAQTSSTHNTPLSAGGESFESGISISYSIGQVLYDSSERIHHGVQHTSLGCTDFEACNYNINATDNDGSCEFPVEFYDCMGRCLNDSDVDGVCDELEVEGCQDHTACNYMTLATNAGPCTYSSEIDACASCSGATDGSGMVVNNDADNDGICNADEIIGCINASALNYDSAATDADDSCIVPSSISCGSSVTGSTTASTNNYGGISPEEIYRFEVAASGDYEFSTCGSTFDTYLRIYNEYMTEIHSGDDDGDCDTRTILNKFLEPGVYYILIEGYSSYSGSYELTVTCPISGTIGCSPQEVLDCNGNCAPSIWLSDGHCDDGSYESGGHFIFFNCETHNNDQGDCGTTIGSNDGNISIHNSMYNVEVQMYDSYGDGWNDNTYNIFNSWDFVEAQGGLLSGDGGTDHWSLAEGCYSFEVGGGAWPEEVSWRVQVSHPDAGSWIIQREAGNAIGRFELPVGSSNYCSQIGLHHWARMDDSTQPEEVMESEDEMILSASFQTQTKLLSIEVENHGKQKLDYQLYDVLGNLLDTDQLTGALTHINMSHLPQAVYMLKVNTAEKETIKTFKIVNH